MKLAFLYAGQGSQHAGMGQDLYEKYPAFRKVFDAADPGFDLKRVCFEDPDGILNQTEYTQPCMVAFAAGMTAILKERGVMPEYAAGLSLGEYSALTAAGVFTASKAVELAAFRGRAMKEAAAGTESAMVAVMKCERSVLEAITEKAGKAGLVQICNYNCPGQIVISGEKAAVELAAAMAKSEAGARCVPLKVSGPFHTALMAPAGEKLAEYFAGMQFEAPKIPVLFNCLGREKDEPDSIPALLVKQVQSSVYMEDTIRRLSELGVDTIVEIGPGKALSGFVKKTVGDAMTCYPVETAEDVEKLLEVLA